MPVDDSQPGRLEYESGTVRVCGNWTLAHYRALSQQLESLNTNQQPQTLDLSQMGQLDTAGAAQLVDALGAERVREAADQTTELPEARRALLKAVAGALSEPLTTEPNRSSLIMEGLADIGLRVQNIWYQQRTLTGFIGLTLSTLALSLFRPRRWRITALAVHIKRTGLDALPIVALLTFLVGAVIAFLGATVLREFGASIYTVNLVAFSFLREFGVLLAAILMAGRTASAYAAQIGAMKANEEIDAIRAVGLNPMELLVLPRVLAMLITLPILTFVGMVSGILGGMAVCALTLDITVLQFMAIVQQDVPVRHLLVGLSKAPVFAFVIAVIGCLEGFKAEGSAESVGEHTTSSVVQSIFMVILLNAVAALFFMEMGW